MDIEREKEKEREREVNEVTVEKLAGRKNKANGHKWMKDNRDENMWIERKRNYFFHFCLLKGTFQIP